VAEIVLELRTFPLGAALNLRILRTLKQVLVFFSSCNAVKYYAELLNFVDIPVLDLHGTSWFIDYGLGFRF